MLRIMLFLASLMGVVSTAYSYSLYSVSMLLKDNQLATEKAAKEKAFSEVLVRVSGQTDIIKNAAVTKIIPQAQSYINQIGFSNEKGNKVLKVDFNEEKIRSLLSKIGAPYWPEPRPDVLFWLIEDKNLGKQIIWEQSNSPLIGQLKNKAKYRGLPILIPIGDFDDVVSVAVPDLWGGFAEQVASAGERYGARGFVIVRIHKNKTMDWQFYPDENAFSAQDVQNGRALGSLDKNLTELVNVITNYYVENTLVLSRNTINNKQLLQVRGVDTTADLFALEKLLKSFSSVASVSVNGISGTTAFFKLTLLVSPNIFENELEKTNRLLKSDEEYIHLHASPLAIGIEQEQVIPAYSLDAQKPKSSPNNIQNIDQDSTQTTNQQVVMPLTGLVYYWTG